MDLQHSEANCVTAKIGFLERNSLFEEEEPYAFRYQTDLPIASTNMKTDFIDTAICDLRGQEEKLSLDSCGFEVRKLRSTMLYEQFGVQDDIEKIFLQDIKTQLSEDYGATDIELLRVRVRRRHPSFPHSIGTTYEHHQPSTAAHIDVTTESAKSKAEAYRGRDLQLHLSSPFQIINVWKPLQGPLEDWPLAICDARTVNTAADVAEATILHENYINHNCQIHFGVDQKWYYLRHQRADEILVFRQFDSKLGPNNGVPHSSFALPHGFAHVKPRESVEVMAALYFD